MTDNMQSITNYELTYDLSYGIYYNTYIKLIYKWVNDIFDIMYIKCNIQPKYLFKEDHEWLKNFVYIVIHKFYSNKQYDNLFNLNLKKNFLETKLIITATIWLLEYWINEPEECREISLYTKMSPFNFKENEIQNKAYEILEGIDYTLHSISLLNLDDTTYIKKIVSKVEELNNIF